MLLFFYLHALISKSTIIMKYPDHELDKSVSYVVPDIQVFEISVEQNVLDGASLDDSEGERW